MNWDAFWPAALAALAPTLVAFAAVWQAIKTHTAVNHRMDELLALAKREATAQATLDEKAAEGMRQSAAAVIEGQTRDDA